MKQQTHHTFDEVMEFLRDVRRAGFFGTVELTYRGQEIVYVRREQGFQPGELPLSRMKTT